MINSRKIQTWLPLLLGTVMAIGMLGGYRLYKHMAWRQGPQLSGNTGSAQQVLDLLKLKYVDSLAIDSMELGAIENMVRRLDPHSVFIPASNIAEVDAELHGNFSGIGVEYQILRDTVMVVYVLEKGPAAQAGLLAGDAIIKVNDSLVAGINIEGTQLRSMLRGKKQSKVDVSVLRNGTIIKKTITRGEVPLPSVDAQYMIAPGVGYIRLNRFAETSFFEFMDAATALEKQGLKQLILDLRGNGGGLLEEATNITDELLEDGLTIVTTKGAHVKPLTTTATKPGIFEKGTLIILQDEQSASASEVIAGALQDHDRATIVGSRSFGKGLVQEQFTLANGGALRLTTARYFTPLGRSIQKPYNGGYDAYRHEVMLRTQNGSTVQQTDTVGKKVFTTRKGKRLYEAGGITPDIQVSADTTLLPKSLRRLYTSNLVSELTFQFFLIEKNTINAFTDINAFNNGYNIGEANWQEVVKRAAADSINLSNIQPAEKAIIEARLKATIARYKWRNTGYLQLVNQNDPVVKEALLFLQKNPVAGVK